MYVVDNYVKPFKSARDSKNHHSTAAFKYCLDHFFAKVVQSHLLQQLCHTSTWMVDTVGDIPQKLWEVTLGKIICIEAIFQEVSR